MKQKSTIIFSTLFILIINNSLLADPLTTTNEVTSSQEAVNQMPINGPSGGMGMMNGQNRMNMMRGRQGNMGMMNRGNCMGMKGQNPMNGMQGQRHMGMMNGGCMNMSMQRHRFVMQNGINPTYINKVNPYQIATEEVLILGKTLYESNCAACHGNSGTGDGPAGKQLTPRPANIAAFSKMPMASDSYLNWTISEGGTPINSPMPEFKSQLNEQEIWQIISSLRRL